VCKRVITGKRGGVEVLDDIATQLWGGYKHQKMPDPGFGIAGDWCRSRTKGKEVRGVPKSMPEATKSLEKEGVPRKHREIGQSLKWLGGRPVAATMLGIEGGGCKDAQSSKSASIKRRGGGEAFWMKVRGNLNTASEG